MGRQKPNRKHHTVAIILILDILQHIHESYHIKASFTKYASTAMIWPIFRVRIPEFWQEIRRAVESIVIWVRIHKIRYFLVA